MRASNIALTTVCVVALLIAIAMASRWGRLRVAVSPLIVPDDQPNARQMLSQITRSVTIAVRAGTIAVVLVLGLGGRQAMGGMARTSCRRWPLFASAQTPTLWASTPLAVFVMFAVNVVRVAAHVGPIRAIWRAVAVDRAVRPVPGAGGVAGLAWVGVSTGQIIGGP